MKLGGVVEVIMARAGRHSAIIYSEVSFLLGIYMTVLCFIIVCHTFTITINLSYFARLAPDYRELILSRHTTRSFRDSTRIRIACRKKLVVSFFNDF